jgi:hypothetical protein
MARMCDSANTMAFWSCGISAHTHHTLSVTSAHRKGPRNPLLLPVARCHRRHTLFALTGQTRKKLLVHTQDTFPHSATGTAPDTRPHRGSRSAGQSPRAPPHSTAPGSTRGGREDPSTRLRHCSWPRLARVRSAMPIMRAPPPPARRLRGRLPGTCPEGSRCQGREIMSISIITAGLRSSSSSGL